MKRNLNWKKVWKYSVIFWGVIFVVSLIPIILLSTYNFPCADDLGYSIYTRHAWVDTHNLFSFSVSVSHLLLYFFVCFFVYF